MKFANTNAPQMLAFDSWVSPVDARRLHSETPHNDGIDREPLAICGSFKKFRGTILDPSSLNPYSLCI
jgi:hypothetical protein